VDKVYRVWVTNFAPEKLEALKGWRTLVKQLEAENACLHVRDLALSGRDLIALGYVPGPGIGKALDDLLEAVLRDEVPNERDALLERLHSKGPAEQ
jgi:tRNA nucleotidyltransferase (CCA-adding enzyme)